MSTVKIFGYGSLINKQSLLDTSPDATDIKSAYIKGFKRSFSLWDSKGLAAKSHGHLRGQPYCALDVEFCTGDSVNGIVFTVEISLDDLKDREYMYKLIKTEAFDSNRNISIGEVYVFSAGKNDGSYDFDSPAQARYLDMCLEGASSFGENFYKDFMSTTYIGEDKLLDFPKLLGNK